MGEYRHGRNTRYNKMRSILIINPNSTGSMTDGLKPLVDALQFKDVNCTTHHCCPATDHS
jgi:Asp/Glu/hydantoin racemase